MPHPLQNHSEDNRETSNSSVWGEWNFQTQNGRDEGGENLASKYPRTLNRNISLKALTKTSTQKQKTICGGGERKVGREAGRQAHKPEGDKFQKTSFLHQKPVLATTNHSKETGARDTRPGNWVLKWTPNEKKLESLRRGRGWDAKERMGDDGRRPRKEQGAPQGQAREQRVCSRGVHSDDGALQTKNEQKSRDSQ